MAAIKKEVTQEQRLARLKKREQAFREKEARRWRGQLCRGCLDGDPVRVGAALAQGADPSAVCDFSLLTPAWAGSSKFDSDLARPEATGRSPLMLAAMSGSLACVQMLLDAGVDASFKLYPSGRTASILAAEFGRQECFEFLAQAAPPSEQDLQRALSDAASGGWADQAMVGWLASRLEASRLSQVALSGSSRPAPRM